MRDNLNIKPVTIIGAGPGAYELLTIKAWEYLQMAEVILYDDLAGDEILQKLPKKGEKIYVGKRYGDNQSQDARLEMIKKEYVKAFKNGKNLVRLKGGDPMVFARTAEEIEFLKNMNIDFEIIPGITSGLAAANFNSIPLTIREKIRNLVFTTLSVKDGTEIQFGEIEKLINLNSAIIIYMGVNKIQLLFEFLKSRIEEELFVCIASNVSLPEEKSISGSINEILNNFGSEKIETPSIIVISKHLKNFI